MKYISQIGIISSICLVGEACYRLLPLPIPASVYGLLLLFVLLCTKVIKPEHIKETADFLLLIMPVFFISPTVSVMESLPILQGNLIATLGIMIVSTVCTIGITGMVAQVLIRAIKRKGGHKHE